MRRIAASLGVVFFLSGCTSTAPGAAQPGGAGHSPEVPEPVPWPSAPAVPDGDLSPRLTAAVDTLVGSFGPGRLDTDALAIVTEAGDARLSWLLGDMLRFAAPGADEQKLLTAFSRLTNTDPLAEQRFGTVSWVAVSNLLIGWDLPAPPGYREWKAAIFVAIEPAWEPFFAAEHTTSDWRWVSWGGVLMDDREVADARSCRRSCIPALDDPALTSAADGDWYADWRPVFGVVVGDAAVAFPRHIMEVHELVNLTVGGRRIGLPYCTLCASAQAYLTDAVAGSNGPLVLRTSGLLSRSNKIMYDLRSKSTFNTFTGRATSGPLLEAGVVLEPVTVVVTTWGAFKAAHPHTRIVAQDGGIGRIYPDDPLEGRDEAGPVFPIGDVDARLRPQERVVGALGPDGAVAFPVEAARAELRSGRTVRLGRVEAVESEGGLRIRIAGGDELPSHQAFWFAWSQFHPATDVWSPSAP